MMAMPNCDQCGQRYTSMLAAAECADFDREEERRTREALRHAYAGPRDRDRGQSRRGAFEDDWDD